MGRGNWRPVGLADVPYEMVYVDLDPSGEATDHDELTLRYEDLLDVIVHEVSDTFWVVDKRLPMCEIEPRVWSHESVKVLMESDEAYLLLADNEGREAICFYPKSDDEGQYFTSFAVFARLLFDCLKVQYLYSISRRAGPWTSCEYIPGERLKVVKNESIDSGRLGRVPMGH